MTPDQEDLDRLCILCGIEPEYEDIWGDRQRATIETRQALLAAMGIAAADANEWHNALEGFENREWRRWLVPVQVVSNDASPITIAISIAVADAADEFEWVLVLESGERVVGRFRPADSAVLERRLIGDTPYQRHAFTLPEFPPTGYHRFELGRSDGQSDSRAGMRLIVTPAHCYQPEAIAGEGRVWGPTVQLYALRSQRNWGIGDFSDLLTLLDFAAQSGAGCIGLSPVHALFPHNPEHASPYSPSSRLFLNVLHVDVEAVADFAESARAREAVQDPRFQAQLRALRSAELVDYEGVSGAKLEILAILYRHFRDRHLSADSKRARAFREFQAKGGEPLRLLARFNALQAHFHGEDSAVWGWPVWPESFRDPASPQVAAFANANREKVEFYEYLQWQAALQFEFVGRRSEDLELGVGIYQDLAVGVDWGGAEGWGDQHLYAAGARIGAPPDEFYPKGQDWGLPPLIPHRLYDAEYQPFVATLRANMRHAGALRIDHVMGLLRLYWVPPGHPPSEGAYVRYPMADLLGILALESQRNHCAVIGEDLGTVPDALSEALDPLGVLSYRVFYFEKDDDGAFKGPAAYPRQALAAVSTHDLPTLAGYWQGLDIDLRHAFGMFPSPAIRDRETIMRAQDRARLLLVLEHEGLLPPEVTVHPVSAPEMTPSLARAVHVLLARSPAQLMAVQLEDVIGQVEQVNLPGTTREYPNWRRKLSLNLEEWTTDVRIQSFVAALGQERERRSRGTSTTAPRPVAPPVGPTIPRTTYRVQFHRGFTFEHAREIVPYLDALGVSHCYASPYLKARPGSMHGYDIIDHATLNPEIGDWTTFDALACALAERGMGQILDIVPNHMGVMGSDNAWWLDVLENGEAAEHARYFDIDWRPLKPELQGRVLLPVLGAQYGVALESGELKLVFDRSVGSFSVVYFEHTFPIDPREYARILGHRLERLEARLGPGHAQLLAFQSLATAFGHLPAHTESDPERRLERTRDKEIHKRTLAELCNGCSDLIWFVDEVLAEFNGIVGEPQSFDLLHELLQAQAYRLAYWRVAADDINYRRFFDINDLAGLRIEDESVFNDTHRLVLDLIAAGKVHGLRIDHPDGLYQPLRYFQQLQDCFAGVGSPVDPAVPAGDKPLYVVVEKILETYERLPDHWPVHGTTGYDFANEVNALLVDASAETHFDRTYGAFLGRQPDFEELLYDCKKLIINVALGSEINVLANRLRRIARVDRRTRDFTLNSLRSALAEVVACFPVYRTYVAGEALTDEDRRYVDWAVSVAKKRGRAADISIFDLIRDVLLTSAAEGKSEAFREMVLGFAMKFQQYTGPVMAKGLEDTSFYRYHRLVSLNEVGGDPRRFGISVAAFHHANQERARRWPHTMLCTSTHDSKRSEDMRARINVLSEAPDEWRRRLRRWSRLNNRKKLLVDDNPAPNRNDEYFLYQTLLGIWPAEPLEADGIRALGARVEAYMIKAMREGKQSSSWINPDAEYEEAVLAFVRALLRRPQSNRFLDDFLEFQEMLARFGLFNGLTQTLLKLTAPGMPDIYQGTELWDFSLVDPDNRRPVDYEHRRQLLHGLEEMAKGPDSELPMRARELLDSMADGRIKLYVTWRTLAMRRAYSELFRDGDYAGLAVEGEKANHVCAFARRWRGQELIVIAPRLYARLVDGGDHVPLGPDVWGDTAVILADSSDQRYRNEFTGEVVGAVIGDASGRLNLADVLGNFPVAALVREDVSA